MERCKYLRNWCHITNEKSAVAIAVAKEIENLQLPELGVETQEIPWTQLVTKDIEYQITLTSDKIKCVSTETGSCFLLDHRSLVSLFDLSFVFVVRGTIKE